MFGPVDLPDANQLTPAELSDLQACCHDVILTPITRSLAQTRTDLPIRVVDIAAEAVQHAAVFDVDAMRQVCERRIAGGRRTLGSPAQLNLAADPCQQLAKTAARYHLMGHRLK